MVTGEPIPVEKSAGSRVIAGTVNATGSFVMRAERVGRDTLLARIVNMVAEAQRSRAPIQRLADRVSAWFVPLVILVAVATFVVWFVAGPQPRFIHAIVNAVAVVIIACPCALGLATPMSVMVAAGKGASAGVLFRNAVAIEVLRRVDTLIIDKTGTVTEGKPRLTSVLAANDFDDREMLMLAASLERASEHALAGAIVEGATQRGIALQDVKEFRSVTGKGVTGIVGDRRVVVGNATLLDEMKIDPRALSDRGEELRNAGQTTMLIGIDGRPAGLIGVADPVKETAAEAIQQLHAEGLRIVMVTGDSVGAAIHHLRARRLEVLSDRVLRPARAAA